MLLSALDYLACPECRAPLQVGAIHSQEEDHIMEGNLYCTGCEQHFPIIRGIPRLLPSRIMDRDWYERTVRRFGTQWLVFNKPDHPFYEAQFLSFIQPVTPDFFKDKVVLDVGCGKGRHARLAQKWGLGSYSA